MKTEIYDREKHCGFGTPIWNEDISSLKKEKKTINKLKDNKKKRG